MDASDLITAKEAQKILGFKTVAYLYRDKRITPVIAKPRMYLRSDVEYLRDHGTVGQPGRKPQYGE